MCGFMVHYGAGNPIYIKHRGPDHHSVVQFGDLNFEHFLLSVTGEVTVQPFVDEGIVCVYNGEIYNYAFEKSDGENLIPLYREYGVTFPQYLDGEFALALYDFDNGRYVFATDPMGTKPLWLNGLECASYKSGVGGYAVPPNTIIVRTATSESLYSTYDFEFDRQIEQTYEWWVQAFEEAVWKRAKDNCFFGLSAGYDSGAIHCAINKKSYKYKTYTITANETRSIIEQRLNLSRDFETLLLPREAISQIYAYIEHYGEPTVYEILKEGGLEKTNMHADPGAIGLAAICSLARRDNRKVYLSGQGADEILADYSLCPWQSTFKGVWPEKLTPWANFHFNCQKAYLSKEEGIAGTFGIETRYPFLDTAVVQSFLDLAPALKNRAYKAPIDYYLTSNSYPFEKGVKKGFSI